MLFSTSDVSGYAIDACRRALGVECLKVECDNTISVSVFDTVLWFDWFFVKLTHDVRRTFSSYIVYWQVNGHKFHTYVAPCIKYKQTKHEKVHYIDEHAMFDYVKQKVDCSNGLHTVENSSRYKKVHK